MHPRRFANPFLEADQIVSQDIRTDYGKIDCATYVEVTTTEGPSDGQMVLLRLVLCYNYVYYCVILLCLAYCCLRNNVSSSAQIFDAFIFAVRAIVPLNVFLVLMISKLPDA